ncbi:MAG: CBS domain-containing protein [Deltaproteobacteria bacterium]|nr:MAG: CBS domain-containing protein [Deltaproteobacteria bacterium]
MSDVTALMYKKQISCLVVCEDESMVGIITERDLARAISVERRGERLISTARDLMSSPVIGLDLSKTVFKPQRGSPNSCPYAPSPWLTPRASSRVLRPRRISFAVTSGSSKSWSANGPKSSLPSLRSWRRLTRLRASSWPTGATRSVPR